MHHRGFHHHYGGGYGSRRGGYDNHERDKVIEAIQEFRTFKPYLKKRLKHIQDTGRYLELSEEVEDIKCYLSLMDDVHLAPSHEMEQIQSHINRIHEMIRKNPMTELPNSSHPSTTDEIEDEFGDEDRPRSPSPEFRGSDGTANDIPLIPTHGAHRTVEVDFSSSQDPSADDSVDEWGRPKYELNYTRRESFKDVDMRSGSYNPNGAGRGQRGGWNDGGYNGAQNMSFGRGRGASRFGNNDCSEFDHRSSGRGRGLISDRQRQNWHLDRRRDEREFTHPPPDWLSEDNRNGNVPDEWERQPKHYGSRPPPNNRKTFDNVKRETDGEAEARERLRNAQIVASAFDRRPSSENRDDIISKSIFEAKARERREEEERRRLESSRNFPPHPNTPPMNRMGFPRQHPPQPNLPFCVPPPTTGLYPPNPGGGLLPTPNFPPMSIPHHPSSSGHLGMHNIPRHTGTHPINYPQQQFGTYNRPIMTPAPSYHRPPPPMIPPRQSPVPPPTSLPPHSANQYQTFPNQMGASEGPSADEIRDISMAKAKNCFKRIAQKVTGASVQTASNISSAVIASPPDSPGPESPVDTLPNDHQRSFHGAQDPRLSRASKSDSDRQQSPPAPSKPSVSSSGTKPSARVPPTPATVSPAISETLASAKPSTSSVTTNPPSKPDAGNVLKTTSSTDRRLMFDEHERKRILEKVKKLDRRRVLEREQDSSNQFMRPKPTTTALELRKQFSKELEGVFRLGRHPPKKQSGSFEDALTSADHVSSTVTSSKSTDKHKGSSKDNHEDDERRQSQHRSHSDKTERERSPKKTEEKGKSRGSSKEKGSGEEKKSDKIKSKDKEKSHKKSNEKSSSKSSSKKKSSTSRTSSTKKNFTEDLVSEGIIETLKVPTFRIPHKPKPVQSDVSDVPAKVSSRSESSDRDTSPEPALAEVEDSDSRSATNDKFTEDDEADHDMEDTEPGQNTEESVPSQSVKSSGEGSSTPSTSDGGSDAMEFLKQFLMKSGDIDPEQRQFILSNPSNLKDIFSKVMMEISGKGKSSNEETTSSRPDTANSESDNDKGVTSEMEEVVKERGRPRVKKRNSKRRSSLEKLHDALKEMRFDKHLPLGPRRCTRGESVTEPPETSESVTVKDDITEIIEATPPPEADVLLLDTATDIPQNQVKKRGRPPKGNSAIKPVPKGKKLGESSQLEELGSMELPDLPGAPIKTIRRARGKRKLATKVGPKRKSRRGPVTRAQAALKQGLPQKPAEAVPPPADVIPQAPVKKRKKQTPAVRKKTTTTMILRRYKNHSNKTNKMATLDTVVNPGLNKVKFENDFVIPQPVKPDMSGVEPLLGVEDEDFYFDPEHINRMFDDLNSDAFANLDKQTDDNMDLTVFNDIVETDEPINRVIVKDEIDLSLEDETPAVSELSFDSFLNGTSSSTAGTSKSSITSISDCVPGSEPSIGGCTGGKTEKNRLLATTTLDMQIFSTSRTSQLSSESSIEATINAVASGPEVNLAGPASNNCSTEDSIASTDKDTSSDHIITNLDQINLVNENSTSSMSLDLKRLPNNESWYPDATSSTSSSSSDSAMQLKPAINEEVKPRLEPGEVKLDPIEGEDSRKFKCTICSFSGKKIVHHYVNKHYPCEIPQAKLQRATFDGLLEMNSSGSPQLLEITFDNSQQLIWPCLYCESRFSCIVEFYDHTTTHTGEFRFECGECGIVYPYQKSLINHVKQHKGVSRNCLRTIFESNIDKNSRELMGFLCNDCYYFQVRFESIMRHIENTSHDASEVKSVRLIRPSALPSTESKPSEVPVRTTPTKNETQKVDLSDFRYDAANDSEAMILPHEESEEPCGESQKVFFGTCEDFSPPSVTLNECTLVIPPVFKDRFLDTLIKKVVVCRDSDSDFLDGEDSNSSTSSRKRKRSDSEDNDMDDDSNPADFSFTNEVPPPTKSNSPSRKVKKNVQASPRKRRICVLQKARLRKEKKKFEFRPDEPNNFFASSDESSDSNWSEEEYNSEEEKELFLRSIPDTFSYNKAMAELKAAEEAALGYLRNNEHLIKTKTYEESREIDKYIDKRNLTYIRRPGDLHTSSTILFGYIRPLSPTKDTKLKDTKELDRIGGVHGTRMFPMKESTILAEMMTNEKLTHLFKCMGTYCSYTTDSYSEFSNHLNICHIPDAYTPERSSRFMQLEDVKAFKDIDCCAYCAARYKNPKDLVDHIINQHGQCTYQCGRCFYRAYYPRYINKHCQNEHPKEPILTVKCPRSELSQTKEATLFQIFVYKCNIENSSCDKKRRFVFREDFLEHIKSCAPKQEMYPCHLCDESVKFERLIEHYKEHNLFKFHCSYCQFGSEVKADLDEHFVQLHPNTSGRVFYRVKPTEGSPSSQQQIISGGVNPYESARKRAVEEEARQAEERMNLERELAQSLVDDDDSDKGRITNLQGRQLYRCVTGDCNFTAKDGESFKEHVTNCKLVADSRSLSCAHCERKLKTVTNLLEHMRVHGEKKMVCSICSLRFWTSTDITKHIKTVHRVMNYRLIKKDATESNVDPDTVIFPKGVYAKSLCNIESFEANYYAFARKAVYSFENLDKLPFDKVFSADLFCAMCPYSTKVRTNLIRHLGIHKQALEDQRTVVPQSPRINPVPYLSREGLEFDKMMNLAASSHIQPSQQCLTSQFPQFIKEQFRFVCSVCDHITSDENLLQTHIKVIHSEVSTYNCPHCMKNPESSIPYAVPLDKIAHHLRLHGPKLYKCGHCMVVHHQLRLMEKHIPEKHPEKKPIHYLIRDVDQDGSSLNRYAMESTNKEKWKCLLCSVTTPGLGTFGSWEESKMHSETVHKVGSQFICLDCHFPSDDMTEMLIHCTENCTSDENADKILVMFSKYKSEDGGENPSPLWKRGAKGGRSVGAVRHIHGNFTEDSVSLIRQYNNNQQQVPSPLKPTKPKKSVSSPKETKKPKEEFKFRCPKCDVYRNKNPEEFRIHLYNEYRYKRWKCLTCNTTFTTEKSLKGHIERDHQQEYCEDLYELQPEMPEIEAEIEECIQSQQLC